MQNPEGEILLFPADLTQRVKREDWHGTDKVGRID